MNFLINANGIYMTISKNEMLVLKNTFQGNYKKVLCVCSGDCLRSPTASHILASPPYNYNTRSCGTSKNFALVDINDKLVMWADVILCMDDAHISVVNNIQHKLAEEYENYTYKKVYNLEIEDDYDYREPELVSTLINRFNTIFGELK